MFLIILFFSGCEGCKGCKSDKNCDKVEFGQTTELNLSFFNTSYGSCSMPINVAGDFCLSPSNDFLFNDPFNKSSWNTGMYTMMVFVEVPTPCASKLVSHYVGSQNIRAGVLSTSGDDILQLTYKVNLTSGACSIVLNDLPLLLDKTFVYKIRYFSPCLSGCLTQPPCPNNYRAEYIGTAMSVGVPAQLPPVKLTNNGAYAGICNSCN